MTSIRTAASFQMGLVCRRCCFKSPAAISIPVMSMERGVFMAPSREMRLGHAGQGWGFAGGKWPGRPGQRKCTGVCSQAAVTTALGSELPLTMP